MKSQRVLSSPIDGEPQFIMKFVRKFGRNFPVVTQNCHNIAAQYRDLAVNLTPANCDRVGGWAEILRRLGDADHGIKPTLFIHERCQKLIEH